MERGAFIIMTIKIRKMTNREFEFFYSWSVEQHVKELTEGLHKSEKDAIKETLSEVSVMLPDGLDTDHNELMTVTADGENVGFIWTVYDEFEGRKQSFVCDFAIWEPKRRKGYGSSALSLAEKNAARAGCSEIVLFVRDTNPAARAFYEKCGYKVLRQEGDGKYMVKRLI